MRQRRTYQVKEAARIAGVSVRTLHHYDELGLLVPSARSGAGYRLYSDDDLMRLQQILIGRELGLPLEEIRRALDEPSFDRRQALRAQREQLRQRVAQTEAMIRAVDAALAALDPQGPEGGTKGETMDMQELFSGFDPARYEQEAEQRWGQTDAYKESRRRTARYSAEDWARQKAEQESIYRDLAAAQQAGRAATEPAVLELAERHRLSIDRWFYPCSRDLHRGLADLYESDSRFADNIDRYGAGLTGFLVAAIRANAARSE